MRMAGFWVVLNLVDLLFFYLVRRGEKNVSFVAFTARRFFKAAGLKSVVLHGLLYYIAVCT